VPSGRVRIDYDHPFNPGNVLAFNPVDVNGKSSNVTRAGEFFLYDEYNPLRRILLDANGAASTPIGQPPLGVEYFLNFSAAEGPAGSVWSIATKPFPGSHFATFPPDLIKPRLAARCSIHF
jgi:hypothetical protein